MSVPVNKEELQYAIETTYEKLKKELLAIPGELSGVKDLEGHAKGTVMSMHNLVSYLVGWADLVLKWDRKLQNNEPVDFPETGFKWNQLGQLAQKFYQDDDFFAITQKLDERVHALLFLIGSKTDEELYGRSWYNQWTLGRMIQFNTSSPYSNALGRIRKWKKERRI